MMSPWKPFNSALRECKRWGVDVLVTEDPAYDHLDGTELFLGPQHHGGICRKTGRILWADPDMDSVQAANLLHELAHVIVWRELGFNPNVVEEPKHMIALEYEACRRTQARFSKAMEGYTIGRWDEALYWHDHSTVKRGEFLARAVGACNASYLMKNGKPTYRHQYDIINGERVRR